MSNENFNEEMFEDVESTEVAEPTTEVVEEVIETEVESTVTEPTEPEIITEEDKSIAHFQKVAQRKDDELKLEIEKRSQMETRLLELENHLKPKEEALVPPTPPSDPDDLEAKINYSIKFNEYNQKVMAKNNEFIQAKQNEELMNAQMLEEKREWLGKFAGEGATPDEAEEAYAVYSGAESLDTKFLLDFVKARKTGGVQQKIVKPKINTPPPLTRGKTEEKVTEEDVFNDKLFENSGSKSLL